MRNILCKVLICLMSLFAGLTCQAETGKTELTWYGHAAFKIVTPQGHVLFVDPWIVNPMNPDGEKDLAAIQKADLVLVSHGHFDHVGNAVEIAKQTKARLVTTFDLGNALTAYRGFPKEQAGYDSLGNFGGTLNFFNDDIKITFIPAVHSSAVTHKPEGSSQELPEYAGNPGGFLIVIKDGPTIYHTGDTDLFSDMALISRHHAVDVMLACIGDHFTMGPAGAAEAVSLVKPGKVVPMHYGTFPTVLTGTLDAFRTELNHKKLSGKLVPMELEKPVHF